MNLTIKAAAVDLLVDFAFANFRQRPGRLELVR
jgi:hypothetical protein